MRSRIDLTKPPGVMPDMPPVVLPDGVFSDSRNVRYLDGAVEKMTGYTSVLGSLSVTATWISHITDGTTRYWVYGGPTVAYATIDGTTHADILGTVSLSSSNNGIAGGAFHGYIVLTDGTNIPQSWTPNTGMTNNLVSLTAWPSTLTTQLIRFWGDFIWCARNTTSGTFNPREIRWSDRAATGALPLSWDYTDPTNQSGITELGQTQDEILDMRRLRDSMIIYKQGTTWTAEFVQGADVFGFRQLYSQSGLLSRNCLIGFGDMHLAVTESDVIIHDGNSLKSIADARVRRWLFTRLSTLTYNRSFVTVDYPNREVLICFPESGIDYPNMALVWNWASDAWEPRELGRQMAFAEVGRFASSTGVVFDSDTGTFDGGGVGTFDDETNARVQQTVMFVGANDKAAYQLGNGETFNGTTMTLYAERRGISISGADLHRIKRIKRLIPLLLGTAGDVASFYIGARSSVDGTPTWSGPYNFTIGTDHKIDVRIAARFLDIKIQASLTNNMRWFGMDIEYEPDGFR